MVCFSTVLVHLSTWLPLFLKVSVPFDWFVFLAQIRVFVKVSSPVRDSTVFFSFDWLAPLSQSASLSNGLFLLLFAKFSRPEIVIREEAAVEPVQHLK